MSETWLRESRRVDLATEDGWPAFLRDDAGHPLAEMLAGMPPGGTMREDGETHREAWARVIRDDPCSYCGKPRAGTIDHIDPKRGPRPWGGAHVWLNFTAACENCNRKKAREPFLIFMARRRGAFVRHLIPARRALRHNRRTRPKEKQHEYV